MDHDLLQKIETLYGIRIFSTKKVRDIFHLITDQGDLCLKSVDYNLKKFRFIYHAIDHLNKNGFQQIPAFIHTLTGDSYFSYNDLTYFISEWMDGREADFKNLADLEISLIALGKLHRTSKGFQPPSHIKIKSRLGKWPERFKDRVDDLHKFKEIASQKTEPTSFDEYFLKHVDEKISEGEMALQILEESNYDKIMKNAKKEGSLCHNDFVYHNVLIDDSIPTAYIVDFDYCRHDIRIYDLARLIRRVIKEKKNHKDLLDVILSAYNSEFPLINDEYPILAAFIQFPQRFWRLSNRYYNQKRNLSDKRFSSQLKDAFRREKRLKSLVKEILHYEKNQS
ncbi:MAG: CotS family spore coat protein [Halanaerobiales bacterium]|nr:CotS family spore coat protein [Halanaerobiales bacterium]